MSQDRRLSIPTMVAFGAGNVAEGVKSTAYGTFLLFFYQQVLGLSGSLAGLALAISVLADAVSDPIIGQFSDRMKSKWGRRHPLIAASAIPLGISFFLLFNPPSGLSQGHLFVWLVTTAVMARIAMTFYDIPHLALGAEMAHDYDQRTTLFTISTWFRIASGAFITYLAYELFFPTTERFDPGILNQEGYFYLGIFCGLSMVVAMVVCVVGTWSEIPYLRKSNTPGAAGLMGFFIEIKSLFLSPSFRAIFIGLFFYVLIVNIERSIGTFAAVHFWGLPTETLSKMSLASLAGAFVAFPLVRVLTSIVDKKYLLFGIMVLAMVNINIFVCGRLFLPGIFPENGSPFIPVFVAINFFFVGVISLIVISTLNSMYGDIADEYEEITDKRREGSLFAARSFAGKAASATGIMLGGVLLDVISFPEQAAYGSVDPEIVWQLGVIYAPGTSIFILLTLYFFSKYQITRDKHAQTIETIRQRRLKTDPEEVLE
ncbi:MAG: MFS transporter [Hyphomonadaceae bacterium]|nr:MFS transporter [Hyphomonadaceae bacterium]